MLTSALLSQHQNAGARLQETAPGELRLLTYGDVPGEYRAGTEGCLAFDQTQRGAVAARGDDAATFLHRLLANDVRNLAAGQGNRNLLLSSKGKVLFEFDLAPIEGGFHLSTPAGTGADLLQALDMYLFADAVELEDVTEAHAPIELVGPQAGALLEKLGLPAPGTDHAPQGTTWKECQVQITALPIDGRPGFRADAGPQGAPALWAALTEAGAQPGGLVIRDILRVEAGQARFGQDIDENVYPQEARLEDAFSLDKGCYIGQEVVAKIDTYGGLNKQLFVLAVDHDDPVPMGTRLVRTEDGEARDLGQVTSWAYSFIKDTGLVLAYIKRKHQELGTTFQLGETSATATIIDPPYRG